MTYENPKISIITVNYNTVEITRDLLSSLERITYPNYELILVDNGSIYSCKELVSSFPWIKYIETGKNLGFAGGNNAGIRVATGEFILLLNNDTEVDPEFLEPLVSIFKSNERIGVVSPKILYFDDPNIIQFAGFSPIHPITGRGFGIGEKQKDIGQFDDAREISRAHGAAMMISRKALGKVGLMPELYFLYYEEMDYCEKFKRAGFEIWYEPKSRVWHKESMSSGKSSSLKVYFYSRNRLLFIRRNTPLKYLPFAIFYYVFCAIPKNVFHHFYRREWKHLNAYFKGFVWNLRNSSMDVYDKQQGI